VVLQVEAGAIGLSVATVWEAVVMAASGIDDIFVVNTVAGEAKLRTLAELARERRILVAVDQAANAQAVAAAASAAGSEIGVLVEVDTGMDRAGVDTPEAAASALRVVACSARQARTRSPSWVRKSDSRMALMKYSA